MPAATPSSSSSGSTGSAGSTNIRSPGPVDRAFALLQIVVAADEPIGVRELARRAGLPPSTTTRTLGILDDLGMVERTPDGAARPGAALATLARAADQTAASLRDRLRPLTVDLVHRFDENAAIAVDDGNGMLYIVSSRVAGALQVPDPTDATYPFHLVAPGLIAMSFWDNARLTAHLESPLPSATPFSVTKPAAVRRRLAAARDQGHAWTNQELDVDVNGLATPILDRQGNLIAAVSLYGPAHRLNPSERPSLAADLRAFVDQRTLELI